MMWLSQSRSKAGRLGVGRTATWRPKVEVLEDRTLPAQCIVTSLLNEGPGTLRECLLNQKDYITFGPTLSGAINLETALPELDWSVNIEGPGPDKITVQRQTGAAEFRIFTANALNGVQISGLTIANGKYWLGGGIHNEGQLTITNSIVRGNEAVDSPCDGSVPFCVAGWYGSFGGGIFNTGTLTILSSQILENTVSGDNGDIPGLIFFKGGGIYNAPLQKVDAPDANLTILDSIIMSNTVCPLVCALDSSVVGELDNGVEIKGGGVYNNGILNIDLTTIAQNAVGPLELLSPSYNIRMAGGGIVDEEPVSGDHAFTVLSSTISDNSVSVAGTARRRKIVSTLGGGIDAPATEARIVNSTISNNVVYNAVLSKTPSRIDVGGGGLNLKYSGLFEIRWTTIAFNVAFTAYQADTNGGGGGVYIAEPDQTNLELRNSIVAVNVFVVDSTVFASGQDIKGTITSLGHNLIGMPAGGSGYLPSDILNHHPLLAPLALNGGPLHLHTHALYLGSPAIDAGDNVGAPTWDERDFGFNRIVNGTTDIGAFECQDGECQQPPPPIPPARRLSSAVAASVISHFSPSHERDTAILDDTGGQSGVFHVAPTKQITGLAEAGPIECSPRMSSYRRIPQPAAATPLETDGSLPAWSLGLTPMWRN